MRAAPKVALGLVIAAAAVISPPTAVAQLPACNPNKHPTLELAGTHSLIIGKKHLLYFTGTVGPPPAPPYVLRIINPAGETIKTRTLLHWEIPTAFRFYISDSGPVTFELTYTEIEDVITGEPRCQRVIAPRVWPKRVILFPTQCSRGLRQRPRSAIVACGDGNLQLRQMRWRDWNRLITRGRGLAWVNDCVPFCAEGTFHYVRARVKLTRPRLCRGVDRYVYTRLRYRYARRPSWITWSGGTVPFPCSFYSPSQ